MSGRVVGGRGALLGCQRGNRQPARGEPRTRVAGIFRPLLGFVRGVNRVGESVAVHAGEMGVLTWRVFATLFSG
jgi:hypothetical protein